MAPLSAVVYLMRFWVVEDEDRGISDRSGEQNAFMCFCAEAACKTKTAYEKIWRKESYLTSCIR